MNPIFFRGIYILIRNCKTDAELDLRNQKAVHTFFAEQQFDAVIDAAAKVGGILANSENQYEFLLQNMSIQNNLIAAAHKNEVVKFVFLGSSCIYPKLAPQPLKKEDIVIYESTVYFGDTEDLCVPVLERISGLTFNKDFFAGYSPERINPGDKERTITKILKVTSGSTPESAFEIDGLYKSIITAGTHLAPSIKVAEAAKVTENLQRDINIAFVNELAKIFNLLDIDIHEVLEAA